MNSFETAGRNGTIRIFASVLLISIHTIVTYQMQFEFIDTKKLIQQIIRFLLTILLMYFLFKGKKWAKIILTVLFSLSVVFALIGLFTLPGPAKIPASVMIIIYGLAAYYLNFSLYFKAYFSYLQQKK